MRSAAPRPSVVDYVERVPIERVYRVTVSAIGRGTGLFVVVFKDQSETRRIDRMRADFIANASHELRTPLASISGFVETLRGPPSQGTSSGVAMGPSSLRIFERSMKKRWSAAPERI